MKDRLRHLLIEAVLVFLFVLGGYLAVALVYYYPTDPSWSVATNHVVQNPGGVLGAWLADFLLYFFGYSAFWWVAGLLFVSLRGLIIIRHQIKNPDHPRSWREHYWLGLWGVGFLLVLLTSSMLEAIRLADSSFVLPLHSTRLMGCTGAGGVLGCELGSELMVLVGGMGAVMFLFLLFLVGLSLLSNISIMQAVEGFGRGCVWIYYWIKTKRERKQDASIGMEAKVQREAHVEWVQKCPPQGIDVIPPVPVVPSQRAIIERQIPLFSDMPDSVLPTLELLDLAEGASHAPSTETLTFYSNLIESKLKDFNVQVKVISAHPGPVITRYEIEPATGVKGSQIVNLSRDLARALSVTSVRIVESIPGKSYMGLEVPNPKRDIVRLSEIIGSKVYAQMPSPLALVLGKDIAGLPIVTDLAKMPHLLVAGTTGSGKSVAINAMILSLLYKASPKLVRLIMIDPKMLELSVYEGIPHLLAPVVIDMKQAANALNWGVVEMDRRYRLMSALGVRNLASYNERIREAKEPIPNPFSLTPETPEPLEEFPFVVIIIDELADLMMVAGKKIEELIARIAQKARAAGIHLIVATQRPSVDVITGLIKANIPTRISFQVSSRVDSRTILDQMGAEALLGQGDMLYLPTGAGYPQRVHGAFVSDKEVHAVVEHIKSQGPPNYVEGILEGAAVLSGDKNSLKSDELDGEKDPIYDEAVHFVISQKKYSISAVQRQFRVGYNRAARLIEDMEKAGLLSPMQSNGSRSILRTGEE